MIRYFVICVLYVFCVDFLFWLWETQKPNAFVCFTELRVISTVIIFIISFSLFIIITSSYSKKSEIKIISSAIAYQSKSSLYRPIAEFSYFRFYGPVPNTKPSQTIRIRLLKKSNNLAIFGWCSEFRYKPTFTWYLAETFVYFFLQYNISHFLQCLLLKQCKV